MLISTIKKSVTLLLLLSLFGQAVAVSVMSCQMEMEAEATMESHSKCGQSMKQEVEPQMLDYHKVCDQSCDCCLGACSANASVPNNLLSLNPSAVIKSSYKELALTHRFESLYRPPITC